MSVSAIHESISRTYSTHDPIIASAHDVAFRQIERYLPTLGMRDEPLRVLELGVGTGDFLARLARLPHRFDFTGVDLSAGMLERARQRVPMRCINCSADQVGEHIDGERYDLVIVHFLLAFVPLPALLDIIGPRLADNGMISLVAATNETCVDPESDLARQTAHLRRNHGILGSLGARAIHRSIDRTTTPDHFDAIVSAFEERNLVIEQRQHSRHPQRVESAEEAYHMFFEVGWFANAWPRSFLPSWAVEPAVRHFLKMGAYPVRWRQFIEIVTAHRAGRHPVQ